MQISAFAPCPKRRVGAVSAMPGARRKIVKLAVVIHGLGERTT